MKKEYLAHSEDTELNVTKQLYSTHIHNVLANSKKHLARIKKHTKKDHFKLIEKATILAAIYHDLGKLDEQAQKILNKELNGKMINHVDAGTAYLLKKYEENKQLEYLVAAYAVLAHHIGYQDFDRVIETYKPAFTISYRPTKEFRDNSSCSKYPTLNPNITVKEHVDLNLEKYIKLHKKTTKIKEPKSKIKQNAFKDYFVNCPASFIAVLSVLVDSDHEDTSINYKDPYPTRLKEIKAKEYKDSIFKAISKKQKLDLIGKAAQRQNLRNKFIKQCNNNVAPIYRCINYLNGVVGIGKTFGNIILSSNQVESNELDTMIFVVPYTALVDQCGEEYRQAICENIDPLLEINIIHSVSKTENKWHRKYVKSFNAPINITTTVNFYNIISSNEPHIIKNFHKFIGSSIVFDESHIMANYEFLGGAIRMLNDLITRFSTVVTFSSGTPTFFEEITKLNDIINPEDSKIKFTFDDKGRNRINHVIKEQLYEEMKEQEKNRVIVKLLQEKIKYKRLVEMILAENRSTFVIMETRAKAAQVYNLIRKSTDRKVHLRFAALSPKDRKRGLETIKQEIKNGEKVVVVGTQGSDIGLDLSFEIGFKELTDFSSVNQFKGRINRNNEYENSWMMVFELDEDPLENGSKAPSNKSLKFKLDASKNNLHLYEEGIPIDACTRMAEEEINEMSKEKQDDMRKFAEWWKQRKFSSLAKEFKLINTPQIKIMVSHEIYKKYKNKEKFNYVEMQENTINIIESSKTLDKLRACLIPMFKESENIFEDEDLEEEDLGFSKTYFWNGLYDPDNLGIMLDPVWQVADPPLLVV